MPLNLTRGDDDPCTPSSRPRAVLFVSVCLHAVTIVGVLILSIIAPDVLPLPRIALAYVENMPVEAVKLPEPPRIAAARNSEPIASSPAPAQIDRLLPVDRVLAPVIAPDGVAPDNGGGSPEFRGRSSGVARIENGPGSGFDVAEIEKPAVPPTAQPVRLHSGIQTPIKIAHVDPVYPSIAQQARVQGVVVLEAVIDAAGRVNGVRVLRSLPLLEDAAIAAVKQWRYTPARLNGETIPVIMTITVNFKL